MQELREELKIGEHPFPLRLLYVGHVLMVLLGLRRQWWWDGRWEQLTPVFNGHFRIGFSVT
jgi:hypothetical protein